MSNDVIYTQISIAVLALLRSTLTSRFKTYSRKFVTWEHLTQQTTTPNTVKQPALFVYDGVGFGGGVTNYVQAGRTPQRRTIAKTLVVYDRIPKAGTPGGIDPDGTPGADALYGHQKAIEDALQPPDSDSLAVITLGGLVTHCWIEGDSVLIPGDIDPTGQGMLTLPLNILIP